MENAKESIIRAAGQCFARYGYSKTTLEDIGRAVGLKKNSLYHYFKNKEELFLQVVEREIEALINDSKQQLKPSRSLKENILSYVENRLERCKNNSVFNTLLLELHNTQSPLLGDVVKLTYKLESKFLVSVFKDAFKKKEIIEADYEMYASSILLICDSLKQREYSERKPDSDEKTESWNNKILFIIEKLQISLEK